MGLKNDRRKLAGQMTVFRVDHGWPAFASLLRIAVSSQICLNSPFVDLDNALRKIERNEDKLDIPNSSFS